MASRTLSLAITIAIALAVALWRCQARARNSRSGSSTPSCEQWSCTAPLIASHTALWPQPRIELSSAALHAWRVAHEAQVSAVQAAEGARLVFLGDSITEGWLRTGFSPRRASVPQPECEAIWRRSFGTWRPVNLAIGGDGAHDLGWRLQNGILPATLNPDVFVLLIGTNDVGKGERAEVALAEILILLRQLHTARPRAQVVLVELLPRGGDVGERGHASFHRSAWWTADWNNHYTAINRINRGLKEFADAHVWVHYVETCHTSSPFLALAADPASQDTAVDASIAAENKNVYVRTDLMYDLLHLSPQGYERFAELLLKVIQPLMDKLSPSTHRLSAGTLEQTGDDDSPRCLGRSCRGPDVDVA